MNGVITFRQAIEVNKRKILEYLVLILPKLNNGSEKIR